MQRVCTKGARNRFPSIAWRVVASVCVLLVNHLKPCPVERCDDVAFRCLACAVQHVQGDLAYLGTAFIDMCLKHDLCRIMLKDRKSTRLNSSHVKNSYAVF